MFLATISRRDSRMCTQFYHRWTVSALPRDAKKHSQKTARIVHFDARITWTSELPNNSFGIQKYACTEYCFKAPAFYWTSCTIFYEGSTTFCLSVLLLLVVLFFLPPPPPPRSDLNIKPQQLTTCFFFLFFLFFFYASTWICTIFCKVL